MRLKVFLARRQELLRGAGRHLRRQRPPNPPLAPEAPQPADPRHASAAGGGLRLRRAASLPAADGGVSAEICGARGGLVDAERDDELGRPTRLPVAGRAPLPTPHFPLYFLAKLGWKWGSLRKFSCAQELKQANASLQLGLMDLQRELDDERAAFRAHFERLSR